MIRRDKRVRTARVNTMKEYRYFIVDMHQRSSENGKCIEGGADGQALRSWGESITQEANSGVKQGTLHQSVAPAVSVFSI